MSAIQLFSRKCCLCKTIINWNPMQGIIIETHDGGFHRPLKKPMCSKCMKVVAGALKMR